MFKSTLLNLCVLGFFSCTLALPSNLGQRDNMVAQRGAGVVEFTTRELTGRNPSEGSTEKFDYDQTGEGW